MSVIRLNFQNNHGNPSSVEPYHGPERDQPNSDDTNLRGSQQGCSLKNMFLKTLQNSQKNTCVVVPFSLKLHAWGLYIYWKETPIQLLFLWILQKILITLLLHFFFYKNLITLLFTEQLRETASIILLKEKKHTLQSKLERKKLRYTVMSY